jgi:hypothetical protein
MSLHRYQQFRRYLVADNFAKIHFQVPSRISILYSILKSILFRFFLQVLWILKLHQRFSNTALLSVFTLFWYRLCKNPNFFKKSKKKYFLAIRSYYLANTFDTFPDYFFAFSRLRLEQFLFYQKSESISSSIESDSVTVQSDKYLFID